MRILAWIDFSLMVIAVIAAPAVIGKPREPFQFKHWIGMIIQMAICIPICGRILGWW